MALSQSPLEPETGFQDADSARRHGQQGAAGEAAAPTVEDNGSIDWLARLTAAKLATLTFRDTDGCLSTKIRTNEEAAEQALNIVGARLHRAEVAEARLRLAEARLNGVKRYIEQRQEEARTSLNRMYGGQPIPALLTPEDILPLVDPQ